MGFFVYLYALARRLDAAHAAWELAIRERDNARSESEMDPVSWTELGRS